MRPNIDIPWSTHGAVKELAEEKDMSLSQVYEIALDHGVESAKNAYLGPDEFRVRNNGKSMSYGPWNVGEDEDAEEWMLGISTAGDGRIRLLLGDEAMYELWTEVQHTPWPRKPEPKGTLVQEIVEHARAADEETLRQALEVFPTGSD